MREFFFYAIMATFLMSCSPGEVEEISPSNGSKREAVILVKNLSKKEIQYCGSAFLKSRFDKAKLTAPIKYSDLPRRQKRAADTWMVAYRMTSGTTRSLSSLLAKADQDAVDFLNGKNAAFENKDILYKCGSGGVGASKKFDSIKDQLKAHESRKAEDKR